MQDCQCAFLGLVRVLFVFLRFAPTVTSTVLVCGVVRFDPTVVRVFILVFRIAPTFTSIHLVDFGIRSSSVLRC